MPAARAPHPLLKLATEIGPLILFFIANAKFNIFAATAVFMVAIIVSLIVSWATTRHLPIMAIISAVIVLVFGTLTLALRDETFIKWKPTLLYWAFALVLLGSAALFGKNLIRVMMAAAQIDAPDQVWSRLNLAWAAFFAFMGAANLYVALNFSTDTWVNFKLFGSMGLMLVFVLAQGFWLSRYMPDEQDKEKS